VKRNLFAFGLVVVAIVITRIGPSGVPWVSSSPTALADGGVIGGRPQAGQAPSQDAANARIGFWRPSTFKAQELDGRPQGLTPAQVKTTFDKFRQISDVVRETPVLKSTVGFEGLLLHSVDGWVDPKENVATAPLPKSQLILRFFRYLQTCATCEIKPEEESSAAIKLWINDLSCFFEKQAFAKDGEDNLYLAPRPRTWGAMYAAPARLASARPALVGHANWWSPTRRSSTTLVPGPRFRWPPWKHMRRTSCCASRTTTSGRKRWKR